MRLPTISNKGVADTSQANAYIFDLQRTDTTRIQKNPNNACEAKASYLPWDKSVKRMAVKNAVVTTTGFTMLLMFYSIG